MPKFIEDDWTRQYKKNYAELLAQLNPKPTEEVLEKLREKYQKAREGRSDGSN